MMSRPESTAGGENERRATPFIVRNILIPAQVVAMLSIGLFQRVPIVPKLALTVVMVLSVVVAFRARSERLSDWRRRPALKPIEWLVLSGGSALTGLAMAAGSLLSRAAYVIAVGALVASAAGLWASKRATASRR